jgi:hypothetical protein
LPKVGVTSVIELVALNCLRIANLRTLFTKVKLKTRSNAVFLGVLRDLGDVVLHCDILTTSFGATDTDL